MQKPNTDIAKILGVLAVVACVAAAVDLRFRRLCVSLLCKLY